MKASIKTRHYTKEEIYYYRLYVFFVKNKFVSYNKFIRLLEAIFNIKKIRLSTLYQKIEYMKANISYNYAEEMKLILDYMVAVKDNNKEEILNLYPEIKKISLPEKKQQMKTSSPVDNLSISPVVLEKSKEAFERTKEQIDIVIKEGRPITELINEGKIEMKNLNTKASYFISRIDKEDYIKFLIANKKLNPISCTELEHYLEVLEFFCKNLDKKVEEFDLLQTEEEIRGFYVSGEENLKGKYKTEISVLRKWKKDKIIALQQHYNSLRILIIEFKKSLDLEDLYSLSEKSKRNIKADMQCIYDYYVDMMKVVKEYNRLCGLNNIVETEKEELKEEFKRQLVLRDND